MKEKELRKHTTCDLCGEKIGKSGLPFFFTVTIKRYGLDKGALSRQQGLAMMMGGNGLLAQVMGPDEDMAKKLDEHKLTVCHSIKCSGKMYELIGDRMKDTEKLDPETGIKIERLE